jgi:inosine-uridine nucleoside N-ribohydrolase
MPNAQDTFGLLKQGKKIPVIFDTDIGGDIDDTWALVLLLKCPEFDVKLVTSDSGNDVYRARLLGKMLEVCKRADVPIGIGLGKQDGKGRQSEWVGDYQLSQYPGTVYEDGIDAIIKGIHACADPVTVLAVGPVPNIAAALDRDPTIANKARFVGMHGSVRRGYGNSQEVSAEYNVRADPEALQRVFAASWDVTITPLDTCGIVHLVGQKFAEIYGHKDPGVQALMANYRVWRAAGSPDTKPGPPDRSSTLFDTVAIYLGFSEQLLHMEDLPLRVTDDGYTVIDQKARTVHCAMKWKDLGAFEDLLVSRLTD